MIMQKIKFLPVILGMFLIFGGAVSAQSDWLDMKPLPNWNPRSRAILETKKMTAAMLGQCGKFVRQPTLAADKQLAKFGWTLVGAAQVYGKTTVVGVAESFDGQCRPLKFQTLVFVGNRVAGTLAPGPMDSRTDGALTSVKMTSETTLTAEYARYKAADALCCPSKIEAVTFVIKPDGANHLLTPESKVETTGIIENQAPGAGAAGDIKNSVWRLESLSDAAGSIKVEKPENYQVEFTADGKILLKADCNGGGASYTTTGNQISIARIFTTKMFCGETSLDNRFLKSLEAANGFRIEGSYLTIDTANVGGALKFFKVTRQN
jgi:heat shock protein HslJ